MIANLQRWQNEHKEMKLKVAVFGMGYVGCTVAACLCKMGHEVVGIDPDNGKVDALNSGKSPISEPGLGDLIGTAVADGKLSAQTSIGDALSDCDLAIVCVGTPSGPEGDHDMRYVASVTQEIGQALADRTGTPLTLAYRSTMRPGTLRSLVLPILKARLGDALDTKVSLVYNPEFLREATAIDDFFAPPKIVVGTADGSPDPVMDALHEPIECEHFFNVRWEEAELTKFVDNSWHALKVAFANEIGRICLSQGLDPSVVHAIFKSDRKLNLSAYYTRPGGAFGGSCLPKDVRALKALSGEFRAHTPIIDNLMASNDSHKNYLAEAVLGHLPDDARVLVSGLAFKADTDDLRESPHIALVRRLIECGVHVRVFDPNIEPGNLIGQNFGFAISKLPSLNDLLVDSDEAANGGYTHLIRTNKTADQLDLGDVRTLDLENLRLGEADEAGAAA